MMTSDALLTGLSGVGALCCVVAFFYALVPIHKANGSKPLLQAIIFLSAIGFIWAGCLLYTSLRYPDRLPESGELLVISLYARFKAIFIALTLIFMSYRIRKAIKKHAEEDMH